MAVENATALQHEYDALDSLFSTFHEARGLDRLWKRITHAKEPPVIHPELRKYAQGVVYMSGKLREDFRILKILHAANPTMIDAKARGSTQAARNIERDRKLVWASWWDRKLNRGRQLDSEVYEAQIGLGAWVGWLRWKQCLNEDGTSDCPVYIQKMVLDAMRWQGDFRNPTAAWCKYSTTIIDCDLKKDGKRPTYNSDGSIGWVGESLPDDFYVTNAGKKIDIIVRDAEDPIAMCPLKGCHHKQRRITVCISKPDGKVQDYEEVESYDSPFSMCSFVIVGGDVNHTERDPHEVLRPSAWILIQLVLEYNNLYNSLYAAFAREMADDRQYTNVGGTQIEIFQALNGAEDEGQGREIDKPEVGTNKIVSMPGPVQALPKPSTAELMALMDKVEREYERYRPNPALTGQMALSEVTGTGAVLQTQGAGMMLSEDLINWDEGHVRIHEETMHGIRFTGHFEPEDEQTRYVATVSGRENVKGSKGGAQAGDELYLDSKKVSVPVHFMAETSKDTPADRRDREERARTAKASGIFVQRDVDEAYGIFDPDMQEELRFAESVEAFLKPLELRRVAALVAARSAAITGIDMGEEQQVANLPLPINNAPQTYNTSEANAARRHAPPVEIPSTGNIGAGGSSGLG